MTERRWLSFPLLAGVVLAVALAVGWAIGKWRGSAAKSAKAPPAGGDRGIVLYQAHCAGCHGPEGHGDGPAAVALRPPPRDFAARPWRFEVSRESIARVIRDGVPGTPMPALRSTIPAADADLLAEYVYRLAISRPPVPHESSAEETLLKGASFTPSVLGALPAFVIEDSAGATLGPADLKGKPVFLHFWGTSCEHCLKEMPALKRLEEDGKGRGLRVIHVCTDTDDAKEAQSLLDQVAPGLRAWVDAGGSGWARFGVTLLPAVWIVDAEGRVLGRGQGARDWDTPEIRGLLKHLLPP